MRHSTLFGVLFIGMTALSGIACTVSAPTEGTGEGQLAVRSVRGHLKSGAATSVVAVVDQAGVEGAKTYSAPVDAEGNFRLTLPKKARYVLGFVDGDQEGATLRFASSAGGEVTSLFPLAGRPERTRGRNTGHESEESEESEEEDDVDLGDVDASEGECEHNPLEQVDWDHDGSSDYEDADDDDDGTADEDDEDNHHGGSGSHGGGRPDQGDGHECEDGDEDGGDEDGGDGGDEDGDDGGDEGEGGGGEVPEIPSPG
ncbi:hypothetical protein [Sorangium sp. So ce131]|uniref:hypothetical protein n=1 Tax=Sorangium sp. So ce131 TaxID=3133282 RepID=UPI003F603386